MPKVPKADRPFMPGYGISETRKGMLPFSHFEKLFGNNRNYFVATTAHDGRPHVMPVWGVWHAGRFYFSTGSTTRKATNLAKDPRCVITAEDGARPVILEGIASRLTKASGFKAAAAVYKKKYDWPFTLDMGNVYEVKPVKAFAFIEAAEQFGTSATRWTFA
jgi:nitroimidazol reductase NimA-like FMN-containing flavoprotein (pyridoxamine 5'-phosphate oxidase superfamily)